MKLKLYITITLEILAIIATLFAIYEIFFSQRIANSFVQQNVDCEQDASDAELQRLRQFLTDNVDQFVYVELNVLQLESCAGRFFEGLGGVESELSVIPLGYDSRFRHLSTDGDPIQEVDFSRKSWFGNLMIDSEMFENQVLSSTHIEELRFSYTLDGLVYIADEYGEGESYFNIIPAPFDKDTNLMRTCTRSFIGKKWIEKVVAYFGSCVFI